MDSSLAQTYAEITLKERYPNGYISSGKLKRIALAVGETRLIKAVNQYYYILNSKYSDLISVVSDDERVYNLTDASLSDQQDEHFGYITLKNLATVPITLEFWVVSAIPKENIKHLEISVLG